MSKLTPKQEMFCREYIIDMNATQAATRSGYSPKTANEQGARLLANVSVRQRIEELKGQREKRTGMTADRVLLEIERLANFDPADLVDVRSLEDIKKLPEDVRRAIVGWKITNHGLEIKLVKEKALEMLARHHTLFTDKLEVSGDISISETLRKARERAKQKDES